MASPKYDNNGDVMYEAKFSAIQAPQLTSLDPDHIYEFINRYSRYSELYVRYHGVNPHDAEKEKEHAEVSAKAPSKDDPSSSSMGDDKVDNQNDEGNNADVHVVMPGKMLRMIDCISSQVKRVLMFKHREVLSSEESFTAYLMKEQQLSDIVDISNAFSNLSMDMSIKSVRARLSAYDINFLNIVDRCAKG